MLGDEIIPSQGNGFGPAIFGDGVQQLPQDGEADLLVDAILLGVEGDEPDMSTMSLENTFRVRPPLQSQDGLVDAVGRQLLGLGPGEGLARHGQNLPGEGIGNGLCQDLTRQADQMSIFLLNLYRPTLDTS